MASPNSAWRTYDVGMPSPGTEGNREDLLDLITNLDKEKVAALFMALPKTTTNSMTHEWLIDTLASTTAMTGGTTEGDDFSAVLLSGRTRLNNQVQTFRRDFLVTLDQLKLSQNGVTAGVPNEYEYQVGKKLMEATQAMDARIVALGTSVASASASGGNRLMAALRAFSGSAITFSNSAGGITLANILTLHEQMFGAGARPDTLVCSHGVKADITRIVMNDQSSARAQYVLPAGQAYDQNVEYMRTDFGRVAIITDIFVPQSSATAAARIDSPAVFLFDKSKIRIAFFRPLRHYPLPPSGDSIRGYIHGSCTLEVLHPSALGWVDEVTT